MTHTERKKCVPTYSFGIAPSRLNEEEVKSQSVRVIENIIINLLVSYFISKTKRSYFITLDSASSLMLFSEASTQLFNIFRKMLNLESMEKMQ